MDTFNDFEPFWEDDRVEVSVSSTFSELLDYLKNEKGIRDLELPAIEAKFRDSILPDFYEKYAYILKKLLDIKDFKFLEIHNKVIFYSTFAERNRP